MAKKADEAKNAKLMDDRAKALETTLPRWKSSLARVP